MSDYISDEVLIEILLKLPVKSLIRAWSVCKAWQSLIRSPLFESLYLANTEKQHLVRAYSFSNNRYHYSLIAKTEPLSIKSIDFPFNVPIGTNCIIKGSCNGLLCFSIQSLKFNNSKPPRYVHVIIWNPYVRNHVVLPQPLRNPSETNQVALGFGVASNVYKVVRLVYNIKQAPNYPDVIVGSRAEIFTLGTTSWRKLISNGGIDIVGRVRPNHEYCWFFKGFVHWIVFESKDPFVHRNSILTFHVGDEVIGEIKLPKELNRETVETLAVIGESLGLVDYNGEVGRRRCDVWIMKDYGVSESWTKLYRIDCGVRSGVRSVVGFLENNELVLLATNSLGFLIYNAKTKKSKYVGNFGLNRCSWYVDDFKESLVFARRIYIVR